MSTRSVKTYNHLDTHPHFGKIGGKSLAMWFESTPQLPPPTRSVVLATSERTGSEWLCQLMGGTKKMGTPSEYFNTVWMQRFIPDYPEDVALQAKVGHRIGCTTNGVFAAKVHPWHFDRFAGQVPFDTIFPFPVFVHLVRQDRLAQAISLYRARYSGSYHADVRAERSVEYQGDVIARTAIELEEAEMRWRMYFMKNQIQPLTLSYEELLVNPKLCLRKIAKHAGVSLGWFLNMPKHSLRIQRDAVTEEWRERFRTDFGDLEVLGLKGIN